MDVGEDRGRLVGRVAEMGALEALLAEASAGRLRIALIDGEAGIGKTTLVEAIEPAARALGFERFVGRSDPLERARPFGPLADAFGCIAGASDPRCAAIAAELSSSALSAEEASAAEHRVIDLFAALVEEMALEHPVIVALEDLHWADVGTLSALRSFSRRLSFLPVAILGTSRPLPRNPVFDLLSTTWKDEGALMIHVGSLTEAEVSELVEAIAGGSPDDPLMRLVTGAAGNPLFVAQLVESLLAEGAIRVRDGTATLINATVPPTLRLTLLSRISFLSEPALDALRLAAVLGSTFSPTDVATIKGSPVPAVMTSLQECARAHLIEEDGTRMRFRHDLIREALYEDMPLPMRLGLHRHAAQALQSVGAPLAQVAQQFALGAESGDQQAIDVLRRAAVGSERSPQTRIELLERALALVKPGDAVTVDIEADLADALVWGGRPHQGIERAGELLGRVGQRREIVDRMRATIIDAMRLGGRWAELVEFTDGVLNEADIAPALRGELLATGAYARACSTGQDVHESLRMAEEAVAIAEASGDEAALCHALVALALAREGALLPGAVDAAARAARIAEHHADERVLRHQPHRVLGSVSIDVAESERAFRTGLRLAEEWGRVTDVPVYLTALAGMLTSSSQWDDALAEAEAAYTASEEVGALAAGVTALAHWTHMLIGRGLLDEAERKISLEESLQERLGPQGIDHPHAHRSMLLQARGDLIGSLELRWTAFAQEKDRREYIPWRTLFFLSLDLDPAKADAVVDWLGERAARIGTDAARREARYVRAVRDGNHAEVLAVVREEEALGWPSPHLDAQGAARGLARVGLIEEALPFAREIADAFEKAHATDFLQRFVDEMRRFGVPIGSQRRRTRPVTGWDALTDSEQRVARLAAQGLTNRRIGETLFVSPRTIQTHLAHAFQKLGINSRVELATEVTRRAASEAIRA